MIRLTFVGDIALDKPLLKAARNRGAGAFDFSDVFHTEDVFADSDLVIGNLETCFGGGNRFNKKPYHYNSPDGFCQAIKDAGIGLVSTANNHCIDEGVKGLVRTCAVLDECGIEHTGTFASDPDKRYLVKDFHGFRVAFYSLTYSVNASMESMACQDLFRYINLTGFRRRSKSRLAQFYAYVVRRKLRQVKSKLRGKSTIPESTDHLALNTLNTAWMERIEREIKQAKAESDLLIVLLHSGGQFNVEPGEHSQYLAKKLCNFGADVIIGHHAHTIQRIEFRDGKLVAYCLGGFCMSVSGEYLVRKCLPEYSLALHLDIDQAARTLSCSVDVLKGTEDGTGYLTVQKTDVTDKNYDTIGKRVGLGPHGKDQGCVAF
ncbi:MAG: CapA family protein [Oscillospiraceae bacterium]|nr:CapA family protein [Oscillospiraceae bacterium]